MTGTVVVNARAETEADGSLLVTWELGGGPAPVDLATGPTPDRLDHRHQTTAPAGQTTCRLPNPGGGRLFVSVGVHGSGSAVVTTDRRVGFRGVTNFRDLGGYRTRLHGPIRWGVVFRADSLHGLLAEDVALYEQLGMRTVYDLRSDPERAENPNRLESRHLNVLSRAGGDTRPITIPPGFTLSDGEQILAGMYKGLIDHSAHQIGALLTGLTEGDALPAVFHCHAGKDRTGVVAAILLEALGVDRPTVLDDYELTARYRLRSHLEPTYQRLVESGLAPEAAAAVLTTPRWAMEEALDHLDAEYFGVDEYLTGPAGMHKESLEALRTRLLDEP